MPLSRVVLERQIQQARTAVSVWVESLQKAGIERPAFRKNVTWRQLNAKCNQIQRRLNSLAQTEATDAEVTRRKTEVAAAE